MLGIWRFFLNLNFGLCFITKSIPVFKSYPQYVTAHDHTIVTIFCVLIRVNNQSICRAKLSKLFHEIKEHRSFLLLRLCLLLRQITSTCCSALIVNDCAIKLFVEVTEQPYDISAFKFPISFNYILDLYSSKVESLITYTQQKAPKIPDRT